MEILVLGDSLPFGRAKHGLFRHKTWPYLLQKALQGSICIRSSGASTSIEVLQEVRQLSAYWFDSISAQPFDIALVQVGIVDTTPRIMPRRLYNYAYHIPGFHSLKRSRRLHEVCGRPWVSIQEFEKNIVSINALLKTMASNVLFIEIASPEHNLITNVGDFSNSVSRRNAIVKRTVGDGLFVSYKGGARIPELLLPDGHHLNENGHKTIADNCVRLFSALNLI